MKYLIIALFALSAGVWFVALPKEPTSARFFTQPTATPIPTAATPDAKIEVSDQSFAVYLQKLDPKTLTLIPNFTQKETSRQIMEQHHCTYGINGGFYTPEQTPIGLLYTKPQFINPNTQTNTFLNGFLTKENSALTLTSTQPTVSAQTDFVIQSGPMIVPGQKNSLNATDEARRMLIGVTATNQWYSASVTHAENTFSGPTLAQLSIIFEKFNEKSQIRFTRILNLDGGSASAFYNQKGASLSELTFVGSFLCASP